MAHQTGLEPATY